MPAGYAGPHAIADFQDIDDPEVVGAVPGPQRLRLGAALRARPPAPLFEPDRLPPRIVAEHAGRPLVPGPEFYAVPGHELGSLGLLQRDGSVFVDDRVQPRGMNDLIAPDTMPQHWIRGLLAPDAEIVDVAGPVGVALHPHTVWGHFLLENLARVHLLAKLRTLGRPLPIAVPIDAPVWVREFVALYFSAGETLSYNAAFQRVRAPSFVLPGMMMSHYHFHPEMNAMVRELLDRVVGTAPLPLDRPRLLYLSRSRNIGFHAIANEHEVEATMTSLGFTVVHPQDMSLRAQLALYAGAEGIVAPYSSVAHNALFAPMGTPVMCFGWMNRCQSGIATLRGQPLAYVKPADGETIFPPAGHTGIFYMRIDCAALAKQVPAFMTFAEGVRRG